MASLKKRGNSYYAQYYIGTKQVRKNLYTENLQVAKEKIRQLESALYREVDIPLPTRTPLPQVITDYVNHLETVTTTRNIQKTVSYLRHTFGPICSALEVKNRKISDKAAKRKAVRPIQPIEIVYFEQITTADIARFIGSVVRSKGIKAKTANRYREILTRLYNWATTQNGINLPGGKNPAAAVERYKEDELVITYLSVADINTQLETLAAYPQLQTMVALYIYAGLRREEALWLTKHDIDLKSGKHGRIHIRPKTFGEMSWKPKTRSRVVPISSALRAYLDQYKPVASEQHWYFPSPEGMWWDPDNFSRELRARNREHELTWSCDEYRHTFGSHLAIKGESLFKISKLMGNSPEICRKHYAALSPECLIDSVEFESEVLSPPQPVVSQTAPIVDQEPVEFPRLRLVVNNR